MADLRACVSTRDEYAFASFACLIPNYRDPVCGVLAAETDKLRHGLRADVLKPNQANTGDCLPFVQFRPEASRYFALHYFRVNPKVGKYAPVNYALNDRRLHHFLSTLVSKLAFRPSHKRFNVGNAARQR